jgi:small subunit ribosomal protein S1
MEAMLAGVSLPKDPEPGTVVKGVVVQVGDAEVFIDIGAKSEASMSRDELVDDKGQMEVKVGDTIEASVVSTRDGIRLSRRMLKSAKSRADLRDAFGSGIPVEGRVESVRKGGFEVSLPGGVKAFCPLSQIDERRVEEPAAWVGRTLEFRIVELDDKARNVVVSRRRLLEQESAKRAEETRKRVVEGAVLKGRVVSLQSYGAFIDLGGIQGLAHVSELSHSRVSHPSEVLKPGDEVNVQVLKVDAESGKVSLGLKQLAEDPWMSVAEKVRPGERLDGKVSRVAEFGAFVEVAPGIEGLVHVSEFSPGKKSADARKLVQPGEAIRVKVLDVDPSARRISLGRVDADAPDEDVEIVPGVYVRGKVERVEPFGIFVRLGPGMTGLVPNEEMGTTRGTDHRKDFAPGSEMEVQVLAVEEGGKRVRLSRAAALARAEREESDKFRGKTGAGGFSTLGDAFKKGFKKRRGTDDEED